MPPDLKKIFDELCEEFKERTALMWNTVDFKGKEFAETKGVEIIDLSPEQVDRWKKATEPIIDQYIKGMVGKGHSETEAKAGSSS